MFQGMKASILFKQVAFATILFCFVNAEAQQQMRVIPNLGFKRGEKLTFRLHYGIIDAGKATISIENENKIINGRSTLHVIGLGSSTGAFSLFFKVRDRYETYIDEQSVCPLMFIRRVDEGGFIIKQDIVFDQQYHIANANGKEVKTPDYIQDMLSAFFYASTFDYDSIQPGKVDSVETYVDNEIWVLKIKFIKRDTLDSDIGKIRCMVFEPIVQKGRIFKHSDDLQVWISDDKNHIPIRAKANVIVGSVKMDLESYSGLPNDFALVK
jgi:hypothetical protein